MQLSEHFTLEEFINSSWAKSRKIDNTPSEEIQGNLKKLAEQMERIRKILGNNPIIVNSGYRNPTVNKGVGGAKTSSHMSGWAIDFVCPKFGNPQKIVEAIVKSDIKYDQCILEGLGKGSWVHFSVDPRQRMQHFQIENP